MIPDADKPPPSRLRVVIVEDSVMLRAGLAELLESRGIEIVASLGDTTDLDNTVRNLAVDLAIIDVRLPPTHTDEGIRAAISLRAIYPELGIVIFSHHIESDLAEQLLATGSAGIGYLLKERVSAVDDFIDALTRVAAGGTALDPAFVTELNHGRRRFRITALTPRENDVLRQMAEGRSNRSIADTLTVGERAVEKHVSSILIKLDIPPDQSQNRRVRAVLAYLHATRD